MNRNLRRALLPILILIVLIFAFQTQLRSSKSSTATPTLQGPAPSFANDLQSNRVKSVVINTRDQTIQVTPVSGASYTVNYPDTTTLAKLLETSTRKSRSQPRAQARRGG